MKHTFAIVLMVFGLVGCSNEITYNCHGIQTVTISKDRTHAKISVGSNSFQRVIHSTIMDENKISYCDSSKCYSLDLSNTNQLQISGGFTAPEVTCQKI